MQCNAQQMQCTTNESKRKTNNQHHKMKQNKTKPEILISTTVRAETHTHTPGHSKPRAPSRSPVSDFARADGTGERVPSIRNELGCNGIWNVFDQALTKI